MRRILVLINNTGIGGTERRLGRLFACMASGRKDTVFVLNRDLWARLVAGGVIPAGAPRIMPIPAPFTAVGRRLAFLGRVGFWVRKADYLLFACWFLLRYGFGERNLFHVVLGGAYVMLPLMMLRPSHRVVMSMTDPNLAGHVGSKWAIPCFVGALRRCHYVDVLTEDIRSALLARGIEPARLILSPGSVVDLTRFRSHSSKECWVVFAGRLVEEKNPRLFLESIPLIHAAMPGARFFLLGEGPLKEAIAASVTNLGLDDLVTAEFRDDIAPILSRGMVFVSLQRRDNYPSQVLLEAMASEMASVATNVGQTGRLIDEETGIRVAPNAQELAQAVVSLLADPARCARLGATARRRVAALHSDDRYRRYLENLHRQAAESCDEETSADVRVSKP
ncbi:MAG: glycosyltransferase [Nitrospiraceae bacterium]